MRKAQLDATQVFKGGLVAGAIGELAKDVISFPLDTIRTRLMTQGSFPASHKEEDVDSETEEYGSKGEVGQGTFTIKADAEKSLSSLFLKAAREAAITSATFASGLVNVTQKMVSFQASTVGREIASKETCSDSSIPADFAGSAVEMEQQGQNLDSWWKGGYGDPVGSEKGSWEKRTELSEQEGRRGVSGGKEEGHQEVGRRRVALQSLFEFRNPFAMTNASRARGSLLKFKVNFSSPSLFVCAFIQCKGFLPAVHDA